MYLFLNLFCDKWHVFNHSLCDFKMWVLNECYLVGFPMVLELLFMLYLMVIKRNVCKGLVNGKGVMAFP